MSNSAYDVLIVDDEKDIRDLVSGILQDEGYKTRIAPDGVTAIHMIQNLRPNLVILDVWLGDGEYDGLKILSTIKNDHPLVPVIMISGHSTIETAVKAIKSGAYDFIEKPFTAEKLLLTTQRAIENLKLKQENQDLKIKACVNSNFLGNSVAANAVRSVLNHEAKQNYPFLILGPTGCGKETFAREMHDNSKWAQGPFKILNSSAFTQSEMEIELLGIETQDVNSKKNSRRIGLLEQANNGTIYIKSIHLMPFSLQIKLFNFLNDGSFARLGGHSLIRVSARVITSTSNDLQATVNERLFRQDLFYKLKEHSITLPALRERSSDIPEIVDHFVKQITKAKGLPTPKIPKNTMGILQTFSWPGNLHQLKNVLEYSIINNATQSNNDEYYIRVPQITPEMLPPEVLSGISFVGSLNSKNNEIVVMPMKDARETFETEYLKAQIQRFEGNISKIANFIGMERSALYRKLKNLGIYGSNIE